MEKVSWIAWASRKASRKPCGVQRHGKALRKAILVERHGCRHGMRHEKNQPSQNIALSECQGKVVLDSLMESNTCATSWKIVTEIKICLATRKRCHGRRHGNSEVSSVMETVTGTAGVKESLLGQRRMESDIGGVSWKSRHGMCHGKHYPSSVTEKPSWKASWKV